MVHAGVDTFFLLYLERFGVRKLEAFFATLVAVMTLSFGVMYFKAECPTHEVILGTVLPRIRCAAPACRQPATVVKYSKIKPQSLQLSDAHTPLARCCPACQHRGAATRAACCNCACPCVGGAQVSLYTITHTTGQGMKIHFSVLSNPLSALTVELWTWRL